MSKNLNNVKHVPIEPEKLNSGIAYQRPMKMKFVDEKASNFNLALVNPPCVSLRDGKYYVVDGQNTIAIWKKVFGNRKIICKLREGLTEAEESQWFYDINTPDFETDQTVAKLFESKLYAKNQDAININKILNKVNYKLKLTNIKGGIGVINAIATIEDLYNKLKEKDFEEFIMLHSAIWNGDKKSLQSSFLYGFYTFYVKYRYEIESKRLTQAFVKKGVIASDIIKEVSKLDLNKDTHIKYAWVIVQLYNKGLNDVKKLKFSRLED